ncbi:MAG: zf-HC2 domain-containing protein [Steroidobacteraceae bacterium]|jgi:Putative zinc-finger
MSKPPEEGRCEEEAARLLPWYAAGRLEAVDAERVTRHLERCAICRDDLAHERTLRALLKSESGVEYAPQPGLAKTLARIDELDREAPGTPLSPEVHSAVPTRRVTTTHWLAAAALLQAVALGILGTLVYHRASDPSHDARFGTLTSATAPLGGAAHIRAVFSGTLPLAALKSLLTENSLSIVAGPSDAGAYTLAFTTSPTDEVRVSHVVAVLRSHPEVIFVEPAVNDEAGVQ